MSTQTPEPRNPFYILLLVSSLVFVFTSLAYAVVPYLEQKAREVGENPPPSPYRHALAEDGWRWILWEVVAMMIFGILSMALDRLRRLQLERNSGTIPPVDDARS